MKIRIFAFYFLFLFLLSCASEKQEPISSATKEEDLADDEDKLVPYLQIDSCLKYSADRLYDLNMEHFG